MSQRIVVGVDGSTHSRHALEQALREARLRSARLEVVHAYEVPVATGDAVYGVAGVIQSPEEAEQVALDVIDDVVGVPAPDVEVDRIATRGPPVTRLLDLAEGADLLVIGSRGRGGFTGLLLGSTSQEVARRARCPVMVVPGPRPAEAETRQQPAAPEEDPMPFHQILVAHDGSDQAQHALEKAVGLATSLDAHLAVLHVVQRSPAPALLSPEVQEYERLEHLHLTARDVLRAAAHRLLDDAMATCRGAGVDAEAVVRTGDPARVITEEANSRGADLVILGSRGLSDAKGLLLGSVSHKVISACDSPVLVVR